MTVTRTFTLDDLYPAELAEIFADWDAYKQAEFLGHVGKIAATWPGTGMCAQALNIARYLDKDGRYVIERIADHAGLIPGAAT